MKHLEALLYVCSEEGKHGKTGEVWAEDPGKGKESSYLLQSSDL